MESFFETFHKPIQDQINIYSNICFGSIGTEYLHILIIKDGEIISVGSLLYRCFRDFSRQPNIGNLLIELGKECQRYIDGKRVNEPILCFIDDVLTVTKGRLNKS